MRLMLVCTLLLHCRGADGFRRSSRVRLCITLAIAFLGLHCRPEQTKGELYRLSHFPGAWAGVTDYSAQWQAYYAQWYGWAPPPPLQTWPPPPPPGAPPGHEYGAYAQAYPAHVPVHLPAFAPGTPQVCQTHSVTICLTVHEALQKSPKDLLHRWCKCLLFSSRFYVITNLHIVSSFAGLPSMCHGCCICCRECSFHRQIMVLSCQKHDLS